MTRTVTEHVRQRLRSVAGDDALLDDAAAWHRAWRGSVHDAAARTVVAPASAESVAAVLALCSEEGWPVLPAGAGSWLHDDHRGAPEARHAIVLTTTRLAGIREYEPADLTAGAGAGTTLAALQAELAGHRQWLALDPPALPGATIGATVALAAAGPLRHAFGTPRDAVLGLELATGDGRLLQLGGRVVKNVAGYDVVRLVVGSRGALGVVTRVHVRLRPLADHDGTWSLPLPQPDPAHVEQLARALEPVALEWIDGILLVRVHGNAAALAAADALLRAHDGAARLAGNEAAGAWAALSEREATAHFVATMRALPTALPALLAAARTLAADIERAVTGASVNVAAHTADGIVRVMATSPVAQLAAWQPLTPALEAARDAVRAAGGGVTFEPLPVGIDGVSPFEPPGDELKLMRGVRQHFDPAGVLVPGMWLARDPVAAP